MGAILATKTPIQMWDAVTVALDLLELPDVQSENVTMLRPMQCAGKCLINSDCQIWCMQGDLCYTSNVIISPKYQEPQTTNLLACYTRHRRDGAVGIAVTSAPLQAVSPLRVAENLVDGKYTYKLQLNCFYSVKMFEPWILFDLGTPLPIKAVKIWGQDDINYGQILKEVYVRVGNVYISDGNFNSYEYIGGPLKPSYSGEMIAAYCDPPVTAQYVSVQDKVGEQVFMQICHFEIELA